jgi:hypothetical protein
MGKVINHRVAYMSVAPMENHIYIALWDALDGLLWISVKTEDAWNVCYLYQKYPVEPLVIIAPQAAQMGWT